MLHLDPEVLPATFAALRSCGGGERECVVYWVGPAGPTNAVTGIVQPDHRASAWSYEVDSAWLTRFLLELRTKRHSVRAQIHTHPGSMVDHSPTDDAFAFAPSPGFVSIVIPHFAMHDVSLDGASATVMTGSGWQQIPPLEAIRP